MSIPLQMLMDAPSDLVTEIGNSRAGRRLTKELVTGAQFQQEYAILRQARINEANRRIEYRRIEGIGELIGRFDKKIYFDMMKEYGPECWGDPDFVEDTLQKNPGLRLRINRPVRVRVDGFRQRSDRGNGADGNRATLRGVGPYGPEAVNTGRARAPFPDLVQGIEHSAAPPCRSGGTAEAAEKSFFPASSPYAKLYGVGTSDSSGRGQPA